MIWEELKQSLIVPGMVADSYMDVFRQLGGALIREGYTKDSYVDALMEREQNYPTGLDINGFGVAIPHTDIEHVNKAAIAVASLNNPVTFFQMGTEDEKVEVRLVFMLAITQPDAHIDELQKILAVIQDVSVLKRLADAKDAQTMIHIIREKEITL